ncbi:hypothetical protein VPH35_007576 [Triticum aestivum]
MVCCGRRSTPVAKKETSSSSKVGLQFHVGRIARFLKAGKYAEPLRRWCPHLPRRRSPSTSPLMPWSWLATLPVPGTTRRPISCIATSSSPCAMARSYISHVGCREHKTDRSFGASPSMSDPFHLFISRIPFHLFMSVLMLLFLFEIPFMFA